MKNIIIKILNNDCAESAASKVLRVMSHGFISSSKHGPSFCACSTFNDGSTVLCKRTKCGYVFRVLPSNQKADPAVVVGGSASSALLGADHQPEKQP